MKRNSIIIRLDKRLADIIKKLKKEIGEEELYAELNKIRYKPNNLFKSIFDKKK